MRAIATWILYSVVAAAAATAAAQPSREMMRLVGRIAAAVNAPPAGYEKFAQENYTAAYLRRQTPAERKAFVERVRAELGEIQPAELERESSTRVIVGINGRSGKRGRLVLDYDSSTFRIDRLELASAGADPAVPPPAPLRGAMPTRVAGARRAVEDRQSCLSVRATERRTGRIACPPPSSPSSRFFAFPRTLL